MSLVERAQERLGELFVMGFEGKTLGDDTSAFISQARIGGVIFFTPNYDSPRQITALASQVQACCPQTAPPLWISVDQEGGKVQRFKNGFSIIPSAAAIGATNSPKLAFEIAEVMAKELRACGINLNFAPVADINTNPDNPVIGKLDRSFGNNEDLVTKMVSSVVRGHVVQGVQPCLKHFPGHGHTTVDSHFGLPKITTSLNEMRLREFRPFTRGVRSRGEMIMSAHLVATAIDAERPATLSRIFLTEILREELQFEGLIFSDDMEMQAITDHFGADEAPRLAIDAGCDALIYRSEKATRHAYAALRKALEDGKLDPNLVITAAARHESVKRATLGKYLVPDPATVPASVSRPEHDALMASVPPLRK